MLLGNVTTPFPPAGPVLFSSLSLRNSSNDWLWSKATTLSMPLMPSFSRFAWAMSWAGIFGSVQPNIDII
jgi:hypothetical protein